jgi:hypothetical protein
MTVATVNPIVSDVVKVAELNRLLDDFVLACGIRRAADCHGQQNQAPDQGQHTEETELGKGIGAAVEDLRHRLLKPARPRY